MKVDSVEPTINAIPTMNNPSAKAAKGKRPDVPPQSAKAPTPVEAIEQNETNIEVEGSDEAKGVIRLLEEGHFKGVADVRLRINFFDELAGKASAAAASAVADGSGAFVQSILSEAQGLLDAVNPDEDIRQAAQSAIDAFQQEVQQAIPASTSDGTVARDALENDIRTAFDALLTELQTSLTPPDPAEETIEPPTDETDETTETNKTGAIDESVVSDTTGEGETGDENTTTIDLTEAFNSLTQTFEDALGQLMGLSDIASNLPPLSSPPNGQGQAYDKFLTHYEELIQGSARPPEEPPPDDTSGDEPIDVIV